MTRKIKRWKINAKEKVNNIIRIIINNQIYINNFILFWFINLYITGFQI